MAGLEFKSYEGTDPKGAMRHEIIANSTTLTIGDVVRWVSGFIALSSTNRMLGIVEGFETDKGVSLDAALSSEFDGTYTPGGKGTGTYVSSGDNQTDKKVRAVIRPFVHNMRLTAPLDATIATTTGSDLRGYFANLVSGSDQISESSTLTTVLQFMLHGQDPDALGNNVIVSPVQLADAQ